MKSIPLWLQLLMVVLLCWLLVDPRFIRAESTQRIAIVLDSSASMNVIKSKVEEKLPSILEELQGRANHAEYFVLSSDSSKPRIYHGDSLDELQKALNEWSAQGGAHSARASLRMARSMVGVEGEVAYLTDTAVENAEYKSHVYSLGESIANCGITGIDFSEESGELLWKVSVRNYSDEPQSRTWSMLLPNGTRSELRQLDLAPQAVAVLQGSLPDGVERCVVTLEPDAFTLDDNIPIVRPVAKTLSVQDMSQSNGLATKIVENFPNLQTAVDAEDVDIVFGPIEKEVATNAIQFAEPEQQPSSYLTGPLVAVKHPLMDGLNWQSLIVKNVPLPAHTEQDEVLLWQGDRALIYLKSSAHDQLIFNFSIRDSNAEKQEAFAVLLWRFIESLREQKVAYSAEVVETEQTIEIASDLSETAPSVVYSLLDFSGKELESKELKKNELIKAPKDSAFFRVKQGETILFDGASFFADTREADFSECVTETVNAGSESAEVVQHTREDVYWRYVLAAIVIALLASWFYVERGTTMKGVRV